MFELFCQYWYEHEFSGKSLAHNIAYIRTAASHSCTRIVESNERNTDNNGRPAFGHVVCRGGATARNPIWIIGIAVRRITRTHYYVINTAHSFIYARNRAFSTPSSAQKKHRKTNTNSVSPQMILIGASIQLIRNNFIRYRFLSILIIMWLMKWFNDTWLESWLQLKMIMINIDILRRSRPSEPSWCFPLVSCNFANIVCTSSHI